MARLEVLPKRLDILDVNDTNCQFRINIDVLNEAFGFNKAVYRKAGYPYNPSDYISGSINGERFRIWMPKLYGNSSGWKNSISSDGKEFYEINEDKNAADWINVDKSGTEMLSLIFAKPDYKSPYRFLGVFKTGKIEHLKHTYERVSTKVKLIGNPVYRIENLE